MRRLERRVSDHVQQNRADLLEERHHCKPFLARFGVGHGFYGDSRKFGKLKWRQGKTTVKR